MKYIPVIYRIALALWAGGASLFTFVLTPAIFSSYDRDVAGGIVGVLFPGYFVWGLACGGIALVCLLLGGWRRKKASSVILASMLAITLVQFAVIEPRAARLKKEIPSFVTTPADDPKRQEFKRLHAFSSAGNLGVIGGGIALLIIL